MDEHPRRIGIRRILRPNDANHRGEVFGGSILAEIDLAGAAEARHWTEHDVATISVKEVEFKRPVKVGDVVTWWAQLVRIGTTSITIRVEVEASRDGCSEAISVTAADVVYVTIKQQPDGSIAKVPVRS